MRDLRLLQIYLSIVSDIGALGVDWLQLESLRLKAGLGACGRRFVNWEVGDGEAIPVVPCHVISQTSRLFPILARKTTGMDLYDGMRRQGYRAAMALTTNGHQILLSC